MSRERPVLDRPALSQIIASDSDTDRIVGQRASEGYLSALDGGVQ